MTDPIVRTHDDLVALIAGMRTEIERLRAEMDQRMAAYIEYQERDEAEIARLQSIIKKQMEPTEISRRLAECNELADAYAEQNVEIERLHKIELQFLALQEERVRWFADNKWLTTDNERLRALLQKLDWKSIDKDNMEFSCRVPYNVMDEIRRALEPKP